MRMMISLRYIVPLAAAVAIALVALAAANVGDMGNAFASAPPPPAFEVKLVSQENDQTVFPYHGVPGWSNVLKLKASAFANGQPATGTSITYAWYKKSWNEDGTVARDWFHLPRHNGKQAIYALQPGKTRSWRVVATNSATGQQATSNELTTTWIDQAPFRVFQDAITVERHKAIAEKDRARELQNDKTALQNRVAQLEAHIRSLGGTPPPTPTPTPAPAPPTGPPTTPAN